MDSLHNEQDESFILGAQREALAQFEQQRQKRNRNAEEESLHLARAIAASEYETTVQNDPNNGEEEGDQELAQALEQSQHEADRIAAAERLEQTVLRRKRIRTQDRNEGSWDCSRCTYTNVPYARECSMCSRRAPPNVLSYKQMSNLPFGLEIEIILPDGKQDGHSLESIARDLTRLGPQVICPSGYDIHRTSDHWKLVMDGSLEGPNGRDRDLCFELVSPILKGEGSSGLGSLRAIMDSVRRLGVTTNASCGFHVHVDASSKSETQAIPEMGNLAGLQRVAQCFVALENAFDSLVAVNDSIHVNRRTNQNRHCKSNRIAFGERSNRQRWDMISRTSSVSELVDLVNPNNGRHRNDRYRKLNLVNLVKPDRPSTCEFRHHGGVQELREAEAWVRLVLQFCEQCSLASPAFVSERCLLHERATAQEELAALFTLVDCQGLEQFFTVERELYAPRINNEWQCHVCWRTFQNCRSLSQHEEALNHYPYSSSKRGSKSQGFKHK